MGGPTFLYFLNQMGQDWTDKYIMDFIPVAGMLEFSLNFLKNFHFFIFEN